ncbi:MAG: T9SS type A sorting domain-containing protein [Bacteroidales bacterium]
MLIADVKSQKPLITISDLAGNKVFEKYAGMDEKAINLDISNLNSGIYLMEVKADTFRKIEKIVVK